MYVLLQHAAGLVCIAHKCIIKTLDSLLKLLIWKSGRLNAGKMEPYHVGDVSMRSGKPQKALVETSGV